MYIYMYMYKHEYIYIHICMYIMEIISDSVCENMKAYTVALNVTPQKNCVYRGMQDDP